MLLSRLNEKGEALLDAVELNEAAIEIYYYAGNDRLYVTSLLKNEILEINPDDLTFSTFPIPNAVREITATSQPGYLALADYLRGKVYLYDLENHTIIHTFLTGGKSEGLAIGPKTGHLYVSTRHGINIFDVPSLLKDFHQEGLLRD